MKIKELKFVEYFVTTEPPNKNQWRGIIAYCGDITVCRINYWDYSDEPFYFNINSDMLTNNNPKFHYFSIEDVKHAAQEIFNEYIEQFII